MSIQSEDLALRRPRPHVGDVIARRVTPTVIKDAMARKHLGLKALAELTREVDPDDRGLSWQLISFLASPAHWGRDTTTLLSAQLLAGALDEDFDMLFDRETVVSRRKGAAT